MPVFGSMQEGAAALACLIPSGHLRAGSKVSEPAGVTTVLLLLAVAASWLAFRLESWSPYAPWIIGFFFFGGLGALWLGWPLLGNLCFAIVALVPVLAIGDSWHRRRRSRRMHAERQGDA